MGVTSLPSYATFGEILGYITAVINFFFIFTSSNSCVSFKDYQFIEYSFYHLTDGKLYIYIELWNSHW